DELGCLAGSLCCADHSTCGKGACRSSASQISAIDRRPSRPLVPRSVLELMQLFLRPATPDRWIISRARFSCGAATEKILDSWRCYLRCYLVRRRIVWTQIPVRVSY